MEGMILILWIACGIAAGFMTSARGTGHVGCLTLLLNCRQCLLGASTSVN